MPLCSTVLCRNERCLAVLRAAMRGSCLCFVWTSATRTWDRPGQGHCKRDYSRREVRFARARLRCHCWRLVVNIANLAMAIAYSTTQIQAGFRGVRIRGTLRRLASIYVYKCPYFQRRDIIRGLQPCVRPTGFNLGAITVKAGHHCAPMIGPRAQGVVSGRRLYTDIVAGNCPVSCFLELESFFFGTCVMKC